MRILVACEFSGIVREAFRSNGHDAWSCDLIRSESRNNYHILGDVTNYLQDGWDMMIAFPPCTYLSASGSRWHSGSPKQIEALAFVKLLLDAPIPKIALENPIGIISTRLTKHSQIIQPWQFGHGEIKATCLWLKNLPDLKSTSIHKKRVPRVHRESPSPDRWKNRSRTLPGIAQAMADQWGGIMPRKAVS